MPMPEINAGGGQLRLHGHGRGSCGLDGDQEQEKQAGRQAGGQRTEGGSKTLLEYTDHSVVPHGTLRLRLTSLCQPAHRVV